MTVALRKTVQDARGFCIWAATAPPRDFVIYHIGNLVSDRMVNKAVHDLAETVLLLQETKFVIGSQHPLRLAVLDGWSYVATRTGGGWAPKSLLHSRITATQYRALWALRNRDAAVSATRTIRDALSVPEINAGKILDDLKDRGWMEAATVKGWQVSIAGMRMLA
jgi:hypothetical protein